MSIDLLAGANMSNTTTTVDNSLKANYNKSSEDELLKACQGFETYFIEQVFKKMKESVQSTAPKGDYVEMFEDKLNQEYANAATEQGGIGLANILYEQMKVNYNK